MKLKTLESDARIKNFIFKEADSPESIPGFPNNGEACREALAADMSRTLNLMTGIDIGVPETHVIKVSAASIDEYGTGEVVGSVQAVAEAESDLLKATMADPTIYAKIPKDCVDSLAVMDIVSLKTDRHEGNFMLGKRDDGSGAEEPTLIPIDHGLSFPSRDGMTCPEGDWTHERG